MAVLTPTTMLKAMRQGRTNAAQCRLVAPPEQGELIQLLRNHAALVGTRKIPLPPPGRLVYPKITHASAAYWVGDDKKGCD